MKGIILLSAILFCTLIKSSGQNTIYSIAYTPSSYRLFDFNDRDSGNYFYIDTSQANNIWKIGTPSKTIFDTAYSSPLALMTDSLNPYPNNNTSSFTFVVYTDDITRITFWHRFNTDSLNDGGVVEFSTDGGVTWQNIINWMYSIGGFYTSSSTISSNSNKPGFTGTSGWTQSNIDGYALHNVRFRFTFTSDGVNTNKDGWMIDDIEVLVMGTGINEATAGSHLRISPNPLTTSSTLHLNARLKDAEVTICDMLGKEIMRKKFMDDRMEINRENFTSGIYFVKVMGEGKQWVEKMVVE